jgi:uracil-DNA glycosylase
VFVGEGPGADEDAQGIPFVGRAGQLLTQMIEGTAKKEGIELRREDVYICNVVKCRPPGNRTPEPDEMEICGQFLYRQLVPSRPRPSALWEAPPRARSPAARKASPRCAAIGFSGATFR